MSIVNEIHEAIQKLRANGVDFRDYSIKMTRETLYELLKEPEVMGKVTEVKLFGIPIEIADDLSASAKAIITQHWR